MPLLDAGSLLVGWNATKYFEQPLDSMWGELNSHGGGINDPTQDQLDSTP